MSKENPIVVVDDNSNLLDEYAIARREYDNAKMRLDNAKGLLIQAVSADIKVGTSYFKNNLYNLKIAQSEKVEVLTDDMTGLNNAIGVIAVNLGVDVASALITWKPSLSKKAYDALPVEAKNLLAPYLKLSYSSPTLSVENLTSETE